MRHKPTRQTLLQRLKDQYDQPSWEEFAGLYLPYIHGVLLKLIANAQDRDDVAQEVLLACWKKLPEFDYQPARGRFRSWLSRTIIYTYGNYRSKLNKKKRHTSSETGATEVADEAQIEIIAEQEWKEYIGNKAWQNVEPQLAPKVREAFLEWLKGRKPKEIAADLDLEENSVHVYTRRVEKKLQRELQRLREDLE